MLKSMSLCFWILDQRISYHVAKLKGKKRFWGGKK